MKIYYETILEDFLDNTDTIPYIYKKYKKIIEYMEKNDWYSYNWKDIIYKYIKNYLLPLIHKNFVDQNDLKIWINEIKYSDLKYYINGLLDKDKNIDYKLIYESFVNYVDSMYEDYDEKAILNDAKYVWYFKLFDEIKQKFIYYLEDKINDDELFAFDWKNVFRYKKEQLV